MSALLNWNHDINGGIITFRHPLVLRVKVKIYQLLTCVIAWAPPGLHIRQISSPKAHKCDTYDALWTLVFNVLGVSVLPHLGVLTHTALITWSQMQTFPDIHSSMKKNKRRRWFAVKKKINTHSFGTRWGPYIVRNGGQDEMSFCNVGKKLTVYLSFGL